MTTANLALQDLDPVIQYTSTGESTFDFPWPVLNSNELKVSIDQVPQVLGVDYTIAGVGSASGGTITFTDPTTPGARVTLWLDIPLDRLTGFAAGVSTLLPGDLNTEFVRRVRVDQVLRRDIGRALRLAIDDPQSGQDMIVPTRDDRAGRFLAFDPQGRPVALQGTGADEGLREDLADVIAGAALVAYRNMLTDAQPRTVADRLGETASILDFAPASQASLGVQRAVAAGVVTLTIPAGEFVFAEALEILTPGSLRAIVGAGREATRLVFASGESGVWIDREMATLSGMTIVPTTTREAGAVGLLTTRSHTTVRDVVLQNWDINLWLGARYYNLFDQIRCLTGNVNCRVGPHPSQNPLLYPNINRFLACDFQQAQQIGIHVVDGVNNCFDGCSNEGNQGGIDLWTNLANGTWGILLEGGEATSFVRCWLEGCRWAILEGARDTRFVSTRMSPGNAGGGARSRVSQLTTTDGERSPNLAPRLPSWVETGMTFTTSAAAATGQGNFVYDGVRRAVRFATLTVNGAAATTKTFSATCNIPGEFDIALSPIECLIYVGVYVAKTSDDPDDDVTLDVTFRNLADSATFAENTNRTTLPVIQTRTVAGDPDTDRKGWQYLGGYLRLREGQLVGDVMRRFSMRLRVGATAKDYSGSPMTVYVADPEFYVISNRVGSMHRDYNLLGTV